MREPRAPSENKYVMARLVPILARLKADRELMLEFLSFAVARGATDPIKFSVRFYNTIGQKNRPPSTFTAMILLEFAELHRLPALPVKKARARP